MKKNKRNEELLGNYTLEKVHDIKNLCINNLIINKPYWGVIKDIECLSGCQPGIVIHVEIVTSFGQKYVSKKYIFDSNWKNDYKKTLRMSINNVVDFSTIEDAIDNDEIYTLPDLLAVIKQHKAIVIRKENPYRHGYSYLQLTVFDDFINNY